MLTPSSALVTLAYTPCWALSLALTFLLSVHFDSFQDDFRCAIGLQDLLDLGVFGEGISLRGFVIVGFCNALWRQFGSLVDLPACTCDAASKIKKHSQLLRLMQFLMGFDDMFSYVRSIILTIEPLPDVKSAFVTLSMDESHRNSNVASKSVKSGHAAGREGPKRGKTGQDLLPHCAIGFHTLLHTPDTRQSHVAISYWTKLNASTAMESQRIEDEFNGD
ncbi:hypothetical protein Tco_1144449 [Tanacetum coccineum]